MSPQKQAAQIANAQKSQGPATEAGRARSSQNSIRHSLCSKKYFIVPEDRPEFDIYYNDLLAALAPEGAAEALLAEAIIMDEWRLTRARQAENQIFCRAHMSLKPEEPFSSAETWLAHSKELATLTLYEQRINRVLTRNKVEFESRQAARQASGADLQECGTLAPHPGGPPLSHPDTLITIQSQSSEAAPAAAEPAELKTDTAAPEQSVGFLRSSATASSTTDPQPLVPSDRESSVGFVHSSVPAPPVPNPQPLTSAAKRPAGFVRSSAVPSPAADRQPPISAAPEPSVGFVHSSATASPAPAPQPLTPAAKRHAA